MASLAEVRPMFNPRRRNRAKPLDGPGRERVLEHIGLARSEVKKKAAGRPDLRDDLQAEALLALVAASARFKAEAFNVPFAGYAWKTIGFHLLGVLRREKAALPQLGDMDQSVADPDGEGGESVDEFEARAVTAKMIVDVLRTFMSRKEFDAAWKVFAEGRSHDEVARLWGSNRNNVRQQIFKARARAKVIYPEELAERGW